MFLLYYLSGDGVPLPVAEDKEKAIFDELLAISHWILAYLLYSRRDIGYRSCPTHGFAVLTCSR